MYFYGRQFIRKYILACREMRGKVTELQKSPKTRMVARFFVCNHELQTATEITEKMHNRHKWPRNHQVFFCNHKLSYKNNRKDERWI